MARQIYIVTSYIVDATGKLTVNDPQVFDSNNYSKDIDRTQRKADGAASTVWAAMCNNDAGRKLQSVNLQTVDGFVLSGYPKTLGTLSEPEPEPEPEPSLQE